MNDMHRTAREGGALLLSDVLLFETVRSGDPVLLNDPASVDVEVRWVHVADGRQVTSLLEGGELVLTTGQVFRESPAETRRFLEEAERAGAVGVLAELIDPAGRPDETAIAILAEAARQMALPVVLVRGRIRFARVTQEAHRLLLNEQLARVSRAQTIHESFTQLSVEGADEQRILDQAVELLGAPVVLEDLRSRVLAYGAGAADPSELLRGWSSRSRGEPYAERAGGRDHGWLQAPVGVRGRIWGRLVLPGPASDRTEAVQVLERAGQALTILRMATRDRQDLLQQARSGLVHDMRRPGGMSDAEASARAETLGLELTGAYLPLVIRLDSEAGEAPTDLQLRERSLQQALEEAADRTGISFLTAQLRPGVLGTVLAVDDDGAERSVEDLCEALAALRGKDADVAVGLGRCRAGLREAAAALDEAVQIAEIAASFTPRDRLFYRTEDARLRGLLTLFREDPRFEVFAVSELGPLLEEESSVELQLLERFLRHGGNRSAVAQAEHLSRPAIYARLRRIEQRLGVPLDDAESRASLHLAVLWHRLREVSFAHGSVSS